MKFMEVSSAGGTIRMSKIVKGADYFGTTISEDTAFALLDRYFELGGNTIDTARIYGQADSADPDGSTYSEGIVGRWLASRGMRKDVVLVTKGCHPDRSCVTKSRICKQVLDQELETSFSELKVDSVDIYFLHRDNPDMPVGEIMDMLDEHVRAGKIRALGASNWTVQRIDQANQWALAHGKTPFTVSQIQWGLAATTPAAWGDPTLVAMNDSEYAGYVKNKIPVMAFASQGGGYYSKKLMGLPLKDKILRRYESSKNQARLPIVKRIAEENSCTPAAVCMAFLTSNPLQSAAIVGCSTVAQLEDSMSLCDLTLTESPLEALQNPAG